MNGTMILSESLHLLTVQIAAATTGAEIIGWIVIPVGLALCALIGTLWRHSITIARSITRQEETQKAIADSNIEIRDQLSETGEKLADFATATQERFAQNEQQLAVISFALGAQSRNVPQAHVHNGLAPVDEKGDCLYCGSSKAKVKRKNG